MNNYAGRCAARTQRLRCAWNALVAAVRRGAAETPACATGALFEDCAALPELAADCALAEGRGPVALELCAGAELALFFEQRAKPSVLLCTSDAVLAPGELRDLAPVVVCVFCPREKAAAAAIRDFEFYLIEPRATLAAAATR